MTPPIPDNLPALIAAKFSSALTNKEIFYVAGTTTYHPGTAFTFQATIAPAFVKKPQALHTPDEKKDDTTPFTNDPKATTIAEIGPFRVLLNKYCAVRDQILLVTHSYKEQSDPLSGTELLAVHRILEALPDGFVAFFNCGMESGASQRHKHVQIVPLGTHGLFPEEVVEGCLDAEPAMMQHPAVPYEHFIFPVTAAATAGYLGGAYGELLRAVVAASVFRQGAATAGLSYNFLMTSSWMMMIPRVQGNPKGVGVNSLGMVGVVWVASGEELGKWVKAGYDEVLLDAGLPVR